MKHIPGLGGSPFREDVWITCPHAVPSSAPDADAVAEETCTRGSPYNRGVIGLAALKSTGQRVRNDRGAAS
jgi:hypothetical protein